MKLVVIMGPEKGRVFEVPAGSPFVVGRGQASDTQIKDEMMSRKHCEIEIVDEGVRLTDVGSASGTLVAGEKISSTIVNPGTVFSAGSSQFRIGDEDLSANKTLGGAQRAPTEKGPKVTELAGKSLGPFELTKIIDKGVSGMIYLAKDKEKDRVAAVKVLLPEMTSDDDQRERFVRAMQTMLPLKDPHILELYNAGKNGPFCWAAMEYVEGKNLAELIDKIGIDGMLDWQEVWRVALHIGRALRVAYDQKIIHRNVTPTNILRRDSDKKCLLGDFMLAKALEGKNARQITQQGQLVGDLGYMAPERTRGEAVVDTRSDIYGLGATCYALLTGKPPAKGNTLPEIVKSIRDEVPPLPKTVHLSIDELFQQIIMKMIAKDPDDRFQSPSALIEELQRIGKYNNLQADWSDWVG